MSEHALYRFYDHAGELLYIGISRRPATRWAEHSTDKPWWSEVQRIAIQAFPDRKSALRAERAAIKSEKPRYNLIHNRPEPLPQPTSPHDRAQDAEYWWRFVERDWRTVTGEQLPGCECCLPHPQSCGDLACVLSVAARAQGAIDGREEIVRRFRNRLAHREFLARQQDSKEVP